MVRIFLVFLTLISLGRLQAKANCDLEIVEPSKNIFIVRSTSSFGVIEEPFFNDFEETTFTRCFLEMVGREFDGIVIDQTERSPINQNFRQSSAFSQLTLNASAGKGFPLMDRSRSFGSNGRLQIITRIGQYARIIAESPSNRSWVFSGILHEIAHKDCCSTWPMGDFFDGGFHLSPYLGRISKNLSEEPKQVSIMRAEPYQEIHDGFAITFSSSTEIPSFGPFEFYLAGLKPASNDHVYPIVAKNGVSLPGGGYQALIEKWVSTANLQEFLGEEIWPPPTRNLEFAFILVVFKETSQSNAQAIIAEFIDMALQIPDYWYTATEGLSTINSVKKPIIKLDKANYKIGDPFVLEISGLEPFSKARLLGRTPTGDKFFLPFQANASGKFIFSGIMPEGSEGLWSEVVESIYKRTIYSNVILVEVIK